eukprot:13718087-Alexandrium_andersonii.AAC.1
MRRSGAHGCAVQPVPWRLGSACRRSWNRPRRASGRPRALPLLTVLLRPGQCTGRPLPATTAGPSRRDRADPRAQTSPA